MFTFAPMKLYPWGDQRPYNSYSRYFRSRFGGRVQKVAIDAGFTCPNRDGTKGIGGCHFCNNEGFNPSYCEPGKGIALQIDEGISFHRWRYKKALTYLAYFQAHTNTYDETPALIKMYEEALSHPEVTGLVIGTRPDCLADDLLEYLSGLSRDHYVHLEIGIESVYDTTLEAINRGHDFAAAVDALERANCHDINTGAHFIFGLPGETEEMMLESAGIISALPLTTVKFHQLQILKGTGFEKMYQDNPEQFSLFNFERYAAFMIKFLEHLNPYIVVERFAGEVPPRFQAAPGWGMMRNEQVVTAIEQMLKEKNTWQGRLYEESCDQ